MVLYSPVKDVHIGRARQLGAGGEVLDPNTIYMYNTDVDSFRWRIENATSGYDVDDGDGNTTSYTGTSDVTETYGATGDYEVQFIFEDIADLEDFRILSYTGTSFSLANLDKATGIDFFDVSGEPMTGEVVLNSPVLVRVEVTSTDVTKLDLSGSTLQASHTIRIDGSEVTEFVPPGSVVGGVSLFTATASKVTELDFTVWGNNFQGSIQMYNCPNLETITVGSSTGVATAFYAYSNPSLTTVTINNWTGLGGDVRIFSCANLQSLVLPASAETFSRLWLLSCDLSEIDITPLTGSNDGISVRLENNSFDAAAVNQVLVDLDNKGWINGSVNVSGTGMAAPDGTSGGLDGDAAVTSLTGKGWTVTTN